MRTMAMGSALLALVAAAFGGATAQVESASDLLEQAVYAEETEGNLVAAKALYEKILRDYEEARAVAAQAQLRLGLCYLKEGREDEGYTTLQELTVKFGDQAEAVRRANRELVNWPETQVSSNSPISWVFFSSREGDEAPGLVLDLGGEEQRLSAVQDGGIISYLPERVHRAANRLAVNMSDQNRALILFELPAEGVSTDVRRAELILHMHQSALPIVDGFAMAVHRIEEPWEENETAWKGQPRFALEPSARAFVAPDAKEVRIDVTQAVREWVAGGALNYGLLLKSAYPIYGHGFAPFDLSVQGPRYTRQEVDAADVEALLYDAMHCRVAYAHFAPLWALIAKAEMGGTEVRRQIVGTATARLKDTARWGHERWMCCQVLAGVAGEEAVPVLDEVLREDGDVGVREGAALALGVIGTPKARECLEQAARVAKAPRILAAIEKALADKTRVPGNLAVLVSETGPSQVSERPSEKELAGRRDAAVEKGEFIRACEWEMERVLLRVETGSSYKDKIDLNGVYTAYVRGSKPTDEQKRGLLEEVKEFAEKHAGEVEYGWRLHSLRAFIHDDLGDRQAVMEALDAALEAYPVVAYSDPRQHSKYHHLLNERAGLVWDEEGVEAAEAYFLDHLANDPKCEYCYERWWHDRFEQSGYADRISPFRSRLVDAYEARITNFPARAAVARNALESLVAEEARDQARDAGDLIALCEAQMAEILLMKERGHIWKDKNDLAGAYETLNAARPLLVHEQRAALEQAKGYLEAHKGEVEYEWRILHLLAAIAQDMRQEDEALAYLDRALAAYPIVDYPEPKAQSKFQHLVNQRAEMLWKTQGLDPAKEWALEQLRTNPRFDYFFTMPWALKLGGRPEKNREGGPLRDLLTDVIDAYKARREAFPHKADLINRYIAELEEHLPPALKKGRDDDTQAGEGLASAEELEGLVESLAAKVREGDRASARRIRAAIVELNDLRAIPMLIGVIDSDNSYDTIYWIGHFGLTELTGVRFRMFHDGPWWRKWWDRNKIRFAEAVQATPIPDFPETRAGKEFAENPPDYAGLDVDTLDGLLELLVRRLGREEDKHELHDVAEAVAEFRDARAIPTMIGVIDADNSYDTVYGVGHFGLRPLTGVRYKDFHDGAWWREWWEENKERYPEEIQTIAIPDLPKTEAGRQYAGKRSLKEEGIDVETVEGLIKLLARRAEEGDSTGVDSVVRGLVELNDARAIPAMVGVIEADNTHVTIYGVGHFGLGRFTGVEYDDSHDGAWWRRWWEENKGRYPEEVQRWEMPRQKRTAGVKKTKPSDDGWFLAGSLPDAYEIGVDETVTRADSKKKGRVQAAYYLKSVVADPMGFGTMMGAGPAESKRGKRMRLSADIKTEGVAQWAGVWLRIDGPNKEALAFDNMANRPITGTTDWKRYEVVLDVPEDAKRIACGVLLAGPGTVWVANVDSENVGEDVAVTGGR